MFGDLEEQVAAFGRFVGEVHDGRVPFPWQSALVRRVLAESRWPDAIDVPTGLGKTATLDVAVFVAAVRPRLGRRRTYFVVDRRIVVDEAHEHAERLANALADPPGPCTRQIAERLRQPGDDDGVPLSVTKMRGGVTWDRVWLQRPDRYAIVTGTVDQIGSRLLFRGYGVGETSRSIDAALVGTDSLILVDEAHLADSFLTTLRSATALDTSPLAPAPIVMTLSATTRTTAPAPEAEAAAAPTVHGITADDEQDQRAVQRLKAAKRLHLVEVKTTKAKAGSAMADAIATLTLRLAEPGSVIGAVVNTVAAARSVFETVRADPRVDTLLLTGRSRGLDRQRLLDDYYPRMKTGRARTSGRPLVVVATQTIEVGANIDLDALVTESAALPALIQRLGRLNRIGALPAPAVAPAIVVHDTSLEDDFIYGPARAATWAWLRTQAEPSQYNAALDPRGLPGGIDARPAKLRKLAHTAGAQCQPQPPYTPLLQRSTLDAWARTSPTPHPDTPIAPFLHGITTGPEPVTLVWRAGLTAVHPDQWAQIIDQVPPAGAEGIEVSVGAARRWLQTGTGTPEEADLDSHPEPDEPEHQTLAALNRVCGRAGQPLVLNYQNAADASLLPADRIRPGMTIIVPAEYGGCDCYGWHPESTTPVADIADLIPRGRGGLLRIGPSLDALTSGEYGDPNDPTAFRTALSRLRRLAANDVNGTKVPSVADYDAAIADMRASGPPPNTPLGNLLDRLTPITGVKTWEPNDDEQWTPEDGGPWDALAFGTGVSLAEDDTSLGSSTSPVPVTLDGHQLAVAARAEQFGRNLGLDDATIAAVRSAGRWHDEGKRDPRFQASLHCGSQDAAEIAEDLLAKSGMDPADRAAFSRARRLAGYPRGMRHEELSERIAAQRLIDETTVDVELVLHLVASHHGRARPLMPPVLDRHPVKIAVDQLGMFASHMPVDWNAVDRFDSLNTRYGRWGLALLESIVRLADIWASQRNEGAEQ